MLRGRYPRGTPWEQECGNGWGAAGIRSVVPAAGAWALWGDRNVASLPAVSDKELGEVQALGHRAQMPELSEGRVPSRWIRKEGF